MGASYSFPMAKDQGVSQHPHLLNIGYSICANTASAEITVRDAWSCLVHGKLSPVRVNQSQPADDQPGSPLGDMQPQPPRPMIDMLPSYVGSCSIEARHYLDRRDRISYRGGFLSTRASTASNVGAAVGYRLLDGSGSIIVGACYNWQTGMSRPVFGMRWEFGS